VPLSSGTEDTIELCMLKALSIMEDVTGDAVTYNMGPRKPRPE
jgi:hypothetical protein